MKMCLARAAFLDRALVNLHLDLATEPMQKHLHPFFTAQAHVEQRLVTGEHAAGDPHRVAMFQAVEVEPARRFNSRDPFSQLVDELVRDRGRRAVKLDDADSAGNPLQRAHTGFGQIGVDEQIAREKRARRR